MPSASPQDAVLVVNAGSSTLKFALYPGGDGPGAASFAGGQIDGLQPGGTLRLRAADGAVQDIAVDRAADDAARFDTALQAMRAHLGAAAPSAHVVAVANRIVHGGTFCHEPVRLDAALLEQLATLSPLAPLHQPHNLAGVRALMRAWPQLPQVGCFDTAFHSVKPPVEARFALTRALHDAGIQRYGFHGLSYDYVSQQLRRLSEHARRRVLMAHLGNGASLCATRGGHCVATSMGFSAVDGLMMGSRSGALDPGVLLHLWREGWTLAQVERLLYKESGLLGVSGLSADMRELRAAAEDGHAGALEALDLFDHRLRREAGGMIATLGGLDLLAFTGGIGEHDARTRARLCDGLGYLGLRLDAQANHGADGSHALPIHSPESRVQVWIVPTDEGRVAAQAAWALLARSADPA